MSETYEHNADHSRIGRIRDWTKAKAQAAKDWAEEPVLIITQDKDGMPQVVGATTKGVRTILSAANDILLIGIGIILGS